MLDPFHQHFVLAHVSSIRSKFNCSKVIWRIWVLIPVPPACKAGALPFELIPHHLMELPFECIDYVHTFVDYNVCISSVLGISSDA